MSTPPPPPFSPSPIRKKYRVERPYVPAPYPRQYKSVPYSSSQNTNLGPFKKTIQGHHTPSLSTRSTNKIKKCHYQVPHYESDILPVMNQFSLHGMKSNKYDHMSSKCRDNVMVPTLTRVCGGGISVTENTSGPKRLPALLGISKNTSNAYFNLKLSHDLYCPDTFDESIHESVRNASIPSDLRVARAGSSLSEKPTHSCDVREAMILTNDAKMSCMNSSLSPPLNNDVFLPSKSSSISKKGRSRSARRNNFRQRNKRRKIKISKYSSSHPLHNESLTFQDNSFFDLIDTLPTFDKTLSKPSKSIKELPLQSISNYASDRIHNGKKFRYNTGYIRATDTSGLTSKFSDTTYYILI